MILVVHPTGNANVRGVLQALHGRHLLAGFATTVGHSESASLPRWVPSRWRTEWDRRSYALPAHLIRQYPFRELGRLGAERMGWQFLARPETGWLGADAVYRHLDSSVAAGVERRVQSQQIAAVYGYEYGCRECFGRAKRLGLTCFYDLPIAYWETATRLLKEEAIRVPAWKATLLDESESRAKGERKTQELADADVVFCPSKFVADSLPAWARAGKEVVTAAFGSPAGGAVPAERAPAKRGRLRVLFAGSMGQRKGLADLFAAMRRLGRPDVELVVMGSPLAAMDFYRREYREFIYEPPRPHADVLRLMRTCDVLALPSIVEGRALVMQEAMSEGLPLLITANTGGEDLVETGRTGFLVPIRSPDVIADRISWFADHRDDAKSMGELARAKAAEYTWAAYGAGIAATILRRCAPACQSRPRARLDEASAACPS